jgi:SpoVK/Ycf46/Vps4 family AAA+-type ATPase
MKLYSAIQVAFFMRKGADCLSKWIGESERQLRLLFDQAYLMRPSIIFFDEIDGLAPVRSSRQDQIHSSIVSTLLALMDGLDNRGEIIVIGATNRIENIDPALRRPGRFDRELRFGLPTRDSRREILSIHTKNWQPPIMEPLLDTLADKSIGYCGADLKGLCAEAALSALRRCYPQVYKTNQKLAIDVQKIEIIEEDFAKAMAQIIPSTHRVKEQFQAPLPKEIRPLLQHTVTSICQIVDRIMPVRAKNKAISLVGSQCCRPRLLIRGQCHGLGLTTYIGPAVLNHLEQLPCHKLDIAALYSNSVRTPEEALFQIFHEAKNTVPSCVYMPHVLRLWKIMSQSAREAFISILNDILPSAPLFLLAILEDSSEEDEEELHFLTRIFSADQQEIFEVGLPSAKDREAYFEPLFDACMAPIPKREEAVKATEVSLEVVPVKECRSLTEKEEKRLRKKEEQIQRELRIFLR